ncbi:hypothetical protein DSM25559_4001 [Agrobacterium rosae]|uniref:Uncharacterized protein n=1 Tax=Agrobacterium rosae TaxID=1972867 RepID=A0A1R3TZ29_9HYPH|nr:hypothetical protein DSM25559_4001 [Agrobacterium rosae]
MQSYSFEIWDGETCVRREIVCETDVEAANRAAIVALAVFLLRRPDLRGRLKIVVHNADGSRLGEFLASKLKGGGGGYRLAP